MRYLIAATVATVAVAATPTTSQANTCSKAYNVRSAVVKKFGKRAPGRNICRYGVLHSTGRVSDATFSQKKRYLLDLPESRQQVQQRPGETFPTALGDRRAGATTPPTTHQGQALPVSTRSYVEHGQLSVALVTLPKQHRLHQLSRMRSQRKSRLTGCITGSTAENQQF
jgi:hypothetical protein